MTPNLTIPADVGAALRDGIGALDGMTLPGRCETCGGSAEVRLVKRVPGMTQANLSIRHTPDCSTVRHDE